MTKEEIGLDNIPFLILTDDGKEKEVTPKNIYPSEEPINIGDHYFSTWGSQWMNSVYVSVCSWEKEWREINKPRFNDGKSILVGGVNFYKTCHKIDL